MLSGFKEFFGVEYAKKEVTRIFELVDVDHSGVIDFSEFIMATINKEEFLQDEKLYQAFKYFD